MMKSVQKKAPAHKRFTSLQNPCSIAQEGNQPSFPIETTVSVYDKIAKFYASLWFKKPLINLLNYFVERLPSGVVLDAGCGPGRDTKYFLDRNIPAIGIDMSIGLIEEARTYVPEGNFYSMDIRYLQFPQDFFAGIWACAVLVHFPPEEIIKTIESFYKVLKPKGMLFLAIQEKEMPEQTWYIDLDGRIFFYYSKIELCEWLERTGFLIDKVEREVSYQNTYNKPQATHWLNIFARKLK